MGLAYLLFAFGTVLPGIFETMELMVGLIEKLSPGGRIAGRPFTLNQWNVRIQGGIGALMLVLLLAFPEDCFCLAWGFAFFLTEPICYWRRRTEKCQVGRSLLGQLAAGDNTRLVALLVSGLICGGLWEAWNVTARTKWIYSVPFFDELKLGEMPVLGFWASRHSRWSVMRWSTSSACCAAAAIGSLRCPKTGSAAACRPGV